MFDSMVNADRRCHDAFREENERYFEECKVIREKHERIIDSIKEKYVQELDDITNRFYEKEV